MLSASVRGDVGCASRCASNFAVVLFPTQTVIVATAEDASRGDVGRDGEGFSLEMIDIHSIHHLHCVVMGIDDDPSVLDLHKEVYAWTESHGPWLDQFPDQLVWALSQLQPDEWYEIGRRWWVRQWDDDEEEVKADMLENGPYDNLRDTIGTIVALAQTAIRDQKKLYWVVPGC